MRGCCGAFATAKGTPLEKTRQKRLGLNTGADLSKYRKGQQRRLMSYELVYLSQTVARSVLLGSLGRSREGGSLPLMLF